MLGVYSIAHAGTVFEIEGIWTHRVIKQDNSVTISLLLKHQKRIKGTLGIAPFIANNMDLYHTAVSTELTFKFNDISTDPRVKQALSELLNSHSQSAILNAKTLADEYQNIDTLAPIEFRAEHVRAEQDSRHRFRIRFPLLSNFQSISKKRDREQQTTFHHAGAKYQRKELVSEIINRVEDQKPMDVISITNKSHIYPNRMRFNAREGFNWPLDYRNKKLERITQVIHTQDGDDSLSYESESVRFLWQLSDNYISKEKFIAILNKIGSETALTPLLFTALDIPEFSGPHRLENDKHESMLLSLHVSIRDYEKVNVYHNILQKPFVENTLKLFDEYYHNSKGDYLKLSTFYRNKNDYYKLTRKALKYHCLAIVNQAHSIQNFLKENKKTNFFGFRVGEINQKDKMHYERKLWDGLRKILLFS